MVRFCLDALKIELIGCSARLNKECEGKRR